MYRSFPLLGPLPCFPLRKQKKNSKAQFNAFKRLVNWCLMCRAAICPSNHCPSVRGPEPEGFGKKGLSQKVWARGPGPETLISFFTQKYSLGDEWENPTFTADFSWSRFDWELLWTFSSESTIPVRKRRQSYLKTSVQARQQYLLFVIRTYHAHTCP